MARITLVTGGCRSGKSGEALRLACQNNGKRVFVATCPKIDNEMDSRILKHQKERESLSFETLEEPIDLPSVFRSISSRTDSGSWSVVVDCISLWVSNCMYHAEQNKEKFDEGKISECICTSLDKAKNISGHIIFVTGEVGLGLVPENKMGRLYRDLLGRANQEIARVADEVTFMVSGLPLKLK